jgi:hypothetical protein
MWEDYDENDESTWTAMEAPSVDRGWEEALTIIGGLNPFGKPNLVWRWGATYVDPMSLDGGLKYWIGQTADTLQGFAFTAPDTGHDTVVKHLADVPAGVLLTIPKYGHTELGQRRIIIENWRSAEFLATSHRYTEAAQRDSDTAKEFFFCAACHEPIEAKPETLQGLGATPPCRQCGSKRSYLRTARFEGHGRLLRGADSEGVYDCFLILENRLGEPMPADNHALTLIAAAWHKFTTQTTRERITDLLDTVEPQQELMREATSPANPFVGPATPGW